MNVESPSAIPVEQPRGTSVDVARNPDAGLQCVEKRLAELETELAMERALSADASVAPQLGVTLALDEERQLVLLPGAASVMVLPCSPGEAGAAPTFRVVGLRSEEQIEEEREVLNAIKSDLQAHQVADKQEAICRFEDEGGPAVEPVRKEE